MTPNKLTVQKYMDGFRKSDHAQILSCLADDVEWLMPGFFHLSGKAAFDAVFCDVFEMKGAKIRRLTSYLMEPGGQA